MKTALCFYGQLRTGEYCFPSIKKNLLDVYKPDVFVVTDSQEKKIRDLYHPVAMEVKSQNDIWEISKNKITDYHNFLYYVSPSKDMSCMWKGLKCSELLRDYEKVHGVYDLVIFGRMDVKIAYVQTITLPKEDTIYIPYINACLFPPDTHGRHFGGVSSHLSWCSSKVAHILMDAYLETDKYYKQMGYWHPEIFLGVVCQNNNIKVEFVDAAIMMIRGTSENPVGYYNQPMSDFPEFDIENSSAPQKYSTETHARGLKW